MPRRAFGFGLATLGIAAAIMVAALTAVAAPNEAGSVQAQAQPLPQTTPVSSVSCTVRVPRLQIRTGPGTVYPVVGQLTQSSQVRAVALVSRGFPSGRWVEVQLTPGKSLGFVAADIQFVFCRQSLAGLPAARIPPTPRPGPTKTPRQLRHGSSWSRWFPSQAISQARRIFIRTARVMTARW